MVALAMPAVRQRLPHPGRRRFDNLSLPHVLTGFHMLWWRFILVLYSRASSMVSSREESRTLFKVYVSGRRSLWIRLRIFYAALMIRHWVLRIRAKAEWCYFTDRSYWVLACSSIIIIENHYTNAFKDTALITSSSLEAIESISNTAIRKRMGNYIKI